MANKSIDGLLAQFAKKVYGKIDELKTYIKTEIASALLPEESGDSYSYPRIYTGSREPDAEQYIWLRPLNPEETIEEVQEVMTGNGVALKIGAYTDTEDKLHLNKNGEMSTAVNTQVTQAENGVTIIDIT